MLQEELKIAHTVRPFRGETVRCGRPADNRPGARVPKIHPPLQKAAG